MCHSSQLLLNCCCCCCNKWRCISGCVSAVCVCICVWPASC